jgi:hypothetical protein
VQKYGKKKCRQIFTGLFFHGKLVVINKFAACCQGKTARSSEAGAVAAMCDEALRRSLIGVDAAWRRGVRGGYGNFFLRKLIN